jgi:hypothetical protein
VHLAGQFVRGRGDNGEALKPALPNGVFPSVPQSSKGEWSVISHGEGVRLFVLRVQQHLYGAVEAIMPNKAGQLCEPHTFVSVGQPQSEILKHIDEREIDLLILGLRRNTHLGMQNRTSGCSQLL